MSGNRISTDAEVASPAFVDKDNVGGDYSASSIRAVMINRPSRRTLVADKWPVGAFMEKGLTLKTGQTHVQNYLPQLLDLIIDGKIDTTDLISHRLPLEQEPEGYKNFQDNQNEWAKVVLKPG